MPSFEDRLWSELAREHGELLALDGPRRPAPSLGSRRALLAVLSTVLLAAVIVASLTLISSTGTTPAYAVSVNRDGSVRVTLLSVLGVQGANETLAKLGVRARVAQIQATCTQTGEKDLARANQLLQLLVEPQKRGGRQPSIAEKLRRTGGAFSGIDLIIHANAIPRGDTLLITAQLDPPFRSHGRAVHSVSATYGLYRGAAPTCRPPLEHHSG
jgi:hypothetical protein